MAPSEPLRRGGFRPRSFQGLVGEMSQRLQGSPDLYAGRGPTASINFITAHDGFTLRDLVHKMLGRRAARVLVVTAAVGKLAMAPYLAWEARAPSDASYPFGEEFRLVMGPLWRIVVASIVAEVVSELLDTEVYHWFVRRVTTRYQWARVAVRNAVSVPVDNALFAVLAFGSLPNIVTAVLVVGAAGATYTAVTHSLGVPESRATVSRLGGLRRRVGR